MPLLINVLRNANTPEYRKLRAKAMECAGLIGYWQCRVGFLRVAYTSSQPSQSDAKFSEPTRGLSLNFSFAYKVRDYLFPRRYPS